MPNVFLTIRKQANSNVSLMDVFETEDQAYQFIGDSSHSVNSYVSLENLKAKVDEYMGYKKLDIQPMFCHVDYADDKWIYAVANNPSIKGKGKTLEAAKLDSECTLERAMADYPIQ